MFDMGPYYLTALVSLLGPVKRVCGSANAAFPERIITSQPHAGTRIPVETPTHVTGIAEFSSGIPATVLMSFDVWPSPLPFIVLYGTEGTMEAPDPNTFGGPVRLCRGEERGFQEVDIGQTAVRRRGVGVADLACSILRRRRKHRADARLAQHVLEVMAAFERSSVTGRHVRIRSACSRPPSLPPGLAEGALDP